VAFLNWRFGLTQMTAWRIEVAPVPGLSNVATPTKAIITIPISIYRVIGMVMMPKMAVPRDAAMGGSMWSTSATKCDADVNLEAVYLFPNLSACSHS
jgi:hypothetical protein